jgi:putative peptidoglycan lipid II flippase
LTVLPSLAILYCFSEEIVNLIFERGKFDRHSTIMTAEALRMYALGLPFYSLNKIWVPTFYALNRQRVPVIASLMSIGFNITFCLLLTPIYGFKVLALGTTLSMLVNAGFQSWMLKKDLDLDWDFFFSPKVLKVFAATLVSALIVSFGLKVEFFTQPFMVKCLIVAAQISAVGLLYGAILMILGERAAVMALVAKITKKFKRK